MKKRVDMSETLTLESIRFSLIRQEDSIIFSLLERAQYCYNANTYDRDAFAMDGFHGSLVEYMVKETEKLHAQVCNTGTFVKIRCKIMRGRFHFHSDFPFNNNLFHVRWVDIKAPMNILSSLMTCPDRYCLHYNILG